MARKRTAERRDAIDNTTEADRERHGQDAGQAPGQGAQDAGRGPDDEAGREKTRREAENPPAEVLQDKQQRRQDENQRRTDAERPEADEERDPHAGLPADDLSEQVRQAAEDDVSAKVPDSVEEVRSKERRFGRNEGVKAGEGFVPAPLEDLERYVPPRPETSGDTPLPPYDILARTGDITTAGLEPVDLAAAHEVDTDAPASGEEGGAPLLEETDQKHHPAAPWPSPNEADSEAPSASPQPGPEPRFQYHAPQPVVFEDKPEAASGVKAPVQEQPPEDGGRGDPERRTRGGRDDDPPRQGGRGKVISQGPAAPPRDPNKGGVPRDEAGSPTLEHLVDKALEGLGAVFRGLGDEAPEPHRLQKALELAARRVMSPQWWDIRDRFFAVSRETRAEAA